MILYALFGLIGVGLIGLNIFASWRLINDDSLELSQKYMQVVLIWCVPLLCALLVIGVTKQTVDKPSGKYRDRDSEGLPDLTQIDAGGTSD